MNLWDYTRETIYVIYISPALKWEIKKEKLKINIFLGRPKKPKHCCACWSMALIRIGLMRVVNSISLPWNNEYYRNLLRFSSGFGWDKDTKKFTAPNEVWNEYLQVDNLLKGHKKDTYLRDDTFEDFEDLEKVYGQNIAKGNNTVGLGDTTDARTYIARDNDGDDENDGDPDADDDGDDGDGVEQASSLRRSNAIEKLPVRKRARTDVYNVEKISDEINAVTGTTNQIVSMIQQRWQKEAEEKEADEKVNNVWDIIKEIPDLEENERFDAMNLVHQLCMKAGFMSMTREERFRWIKRSVRKP
ncbi:hypothetical protein HID58_088229 [Brassica napus]|uniref:At2g29880-like C-terminal domain-containing protein n=1 Tax=Brassica napus TaxID=3708 RepID=A0ABQ7XVL5_BRANA|nr:hypothetical protein HID58_088229 [Brassica napus]